MRIRGVFRARSHEAIDGIERTMVGGDVRLGNFRVVRFGVRIGGKMEGPSSRRSNSVRVASVADPRPKPAPSGISVRVLRCPSLGFSSKAMPAYRDSRAGTTFSRSCLILGKGSRRVFVRAVGSSATRRARNGNMRCLATAVLRRRCPDQSRACSYFWGTSDGKYS